MPLPIDVKPYELNGVVGGDNYMTHYKASNAAGEEFVITEFYPAYMVKRDDDGTLEVSERFSKEFINDREEFVRRAEGFQEIRDSSLHPVVEIFERNHTAYIVRRACGMTTVDQFMGNQTMDFDEAYHFIRPLLLSMAQVADKGMFFNINLPDFRVNNFRQLVLCAPPSWDTNFHLPLIQIIKLYYKLLTGVDAPEQGAPAFSAYGLEVPARIETLVMEILSGDILYGSLDDFYKKFKSLVDGNVEVGKGTGKRTLAIMRGVIAALFVMFALSLVLLAFGGVRAYQVSYYWANPDNFANSENFPAPEFDFSGITLTHPRSTADALSGSLANHDGFIFFRGEGGLMSRKYADIVFIPGATGMSALAEERLIVPDVTPSFIVGNGRNGRRNIYYVDIASGGAIYSASATGENITRVTEHAALNLAIVGDYLFYTNVEENHHLYRLNLETQEHRLVIAQPVYATLGVGSRLFYIVGEGANALFVWNTAEEGSPVQIARNAAGGLRAFNDVLFFINTSGQVQSISFDGRPIATHEPQNVRTFDVYFQWLIFTEEGRHVPRAYNLNTGTFFTLSTTAWVSYIWTHDDQIYGIDHSNPNLVHIFDLPS